MTACNADRAGRQTNPAHASRRKLIEKRDKDNEGLADTYFFIHLADHQLTEAKSAVSDYNLKHSVFTWAKGVRGPKEPILSFDAEYYLYVYANTPVRKENWQLRLDPAR